MRTVSTDGTVEHWGWGQQESSEAGITRALFGSYSGIWSVSYFTSCGPQTAHALMQFAQEETTVLKASGNWSEEGCVCPGRLLVPSTSDQAEEPGRMSDSRSKLAGVTAALYLSADPWFSRRIKNLSAEFGHHWMVFGSASFCDKIIYILNFLL